MALMFFFTYAGSIWSRTKGWTFGISRSKAYQAYFGLKLRDQDMNSAFHQECKSCTESLRNWTIGRLKTMGFGIPMVWREPNDHFNDYCFCSVDMTGFNRHKKSPGSIPILNLQGDQFHTEKRYLFPNTQSYLTLVGTKRTIEKRVAVVPAPLKIQRETYWDCFRKKISTI